jgi:hypothetical protein
MTRASVLVGGVALVVMVASGCGVRSQSSPTAIESDEVPFGLLEPEAGTADPDTGGFAAAEVTIYLMGSNGLLPVDREVARPAGPRKLLRALMAGPTPDESALGLQSALDPDAPPPTVERSGRRIQVELHEAFFTEGGPPSGALAQIVYTLTELEPRARVQFLVEGEPVEVPRGDGVLTNRPVDRDDYTEQAPAAP